MLCSCLNFKRRQISSDDDNLPYGGVKLPNSSNHKQDQIDGLTPNPTSTSNSKTNNMTHGSRRRIFNFARRRKKTNGGSKENLKMQKVL